MESLAQQTKLQVLHFLLQDAQLCIDLTHVYKAILLPSLEIIPNCPNYIAGLMNLAGKSIPIIDLATKLNMVRRDNYTTDTPILLCQSNQHLLGFVIDKILNLTTIDTNTIQMHDDFSHENSYFIGAITLEHEISLLINFASLAEGNLTKATWQDLQ
jgi:purine-binding chemotaxis protein CheW